MTTFFNPGDSVDRGAWKFATYLRNPMPRQAAIWLKLDLFVSWYLSGNFAPIQSSLPLTRCSYTGVIPPDLAGGQYVRNGGNPLANSDSERTAHWFDGDGMLSGVLFRSCNDGSIVPEFVNQYLETDVYRYTKRSKHLTRPVLPSIASLVNPASSLLHIVFEILRTVLLVVLSRFRSAGATIKKISVANTSVVFHDGRALATCESGPPLRFTLPSLETVGWFDGAKAENEIPTASSKGTFGGHGPLSWMREWTTAHPRVDPLTNELISYHSTFVAPYVRYSVIQPRHTKSLEARKAKPSPINRPIPGISSPKMMHDFGVSLAHTVILDLPLSLDPMNLLRGTPSVSYDSTARSRFGVFPRHNPDLIKWFETNPCIIFHTANCWEEPATLKRDAALHLLACRLTSPSMIFSAGNLPTPAVRPVPPEYAEEEQCRLYYLSFPLGDGGNHDAVIKHQWALSAIAFEFPTVAPAAAMRNARYVYGCTTGRDTYAAPLGKAAKIDYLAKMDVATLIARGEADPPREVTGCVDARTEPRFVPRVGARSEDDGFLLTYVFDEAQLDETGACRPDAVSELWVIDAKSMRDVVARVKLPQRVPYGLHGNWFGEEDISGQIPYEKVRRREGEKGQVGLLDKIRETCEDLVG
ncbi:carotenoid cleavage dioxygenase [Verticillium dahliae]|nr:carotenoid cleavage dioxygenase [Verticillium dahliae]